MEKQHQVPALDGFCQIYCHLRKNARLEREGLGEGGGVVLPPRSSCFADIFKAASWISQTLPRDR